MTTTQINKDEIKKEFDELMQEFYKSCQDIDKTCTNDKADKIYCEVIVKRASKMMVLWGYKSRMYCWYDKKGEKVSNDIILKFQIHELKRLLHK